MSQPNERNRRVIEEFRASGGRSATFGADRPLLLLTTVGRKTGRPHTTPVMYLRDGDRLCVFASHGGAPTHPDWFLNLMANPTVTVEMGGETFRARARPAEGAERDDLFARQCALYPQFADYQARTSRRIPVVILERAD